MEPLAQHIPSVVHGPPVLQHPPLEQVVIHVARASRPLGSKRGRYVRAVCIVLSRISSLGSRTTSVPATSDDRIALMNNVIALILGCRDQLEFHEKKRVIEGGKGG